MNRQLHTDKVLVRVHEAGITNGDRRCTHEAVQNSHQLRHLRHLHTARQNNADAATDQQHHQQNRKVLRDIFTENRRQQRDRHADDSVPVAAACGFLVRQAAKGENKKYGRNDVRHGYDPCIHHSDLTYGTFQACGASRRSRPRY